MNKIATKAIVEVCRMREREGDCVVTTQPHSSILESVILELAAQLDVAVEQACAVNAGAEQDDRKTVAPWRKLVKELFLAEEAGDVKFRDCQWASEWSREALCLCGGRPDSVPLAPGVKDAPLHGALAYLTAEVAQYQNPERAPSRIKRAKELLEGLAAEAGKAQAEGPTAEVLDVGDAPNGTAEVILNCSREEVRAWAPLLYKRIRAVTLPPPPASQLPQEPK